MHVALLSPSWPPEANPNGIVTYVQWMRAGLLSTGCCVSVFAWTVAIDVVDPDVHLIKPRGPQTWWARLASRLSREPGLVWRSGELIASTIEEIAARHPIDVVEMEESFGWAADVQARLSVPVVVKLHGPAFLHLVDEELRTPFGQMKVKKEGEALRRMSYITSPSQSHLTDTLARYALHPRMAEHIVNPLSDDPLVPLWSLDGCSKTTLLFVGRFDKVKGGDLVLLALQRLLRNRPGLRLVFVGPDKGLIKADGQMMSLRDFVASLEDSELAQALDFRGRLARDEIAVLRTQALCTIVASRRESQGYTALEAMLQGCPVVTTDCSGLREIVEHEITGLKARSGDANDLAAQVERIIEAPEFGRFLGEAAMRYVRRYHDPAAVAEQTLAFYQRAVAHRSAGSIPVRDRQVTEQL